jgi:predicted PurR-regulated permease PerM
MVDGRAADTRMFVRQTLIVLALVALALFLWHVAYALILAFGGILFAVFLRGLAGKLQTATGAGMGLSLAIVGAILLALVVLAGVLIGPSIADQMGQLGDTLSKAWSQLRSYLEQTGWGKRLLESASESVGQGGTVMSVATTALARVADAVFALVLVLVAGVYFAIAPKTYTEGFVRLFPKPHHERGRQVLDAVGGALWLWLLGQFALMVVVGVITAVGLFVIGVPLALALGLIAGLLEFVPFLGPIVAAIPVLLVALTVGTDTFLYAGLLFVAIQQIESNVLEPMVQRKAVSLPPVLILFAAIAFTLLFGIAGAIIATPLLVVIIVCVKMLYMHDALEERVEVPGGPTER